MDAGGTLARRQAVEPSREQRPRATQEAKADDCMDAGGRATQEAKADDCMDAGGRATQEAKADDCMDAGGRATQEAKADDCMDAGGRATQEAKADDCMDAGGRATQEAKAENRTGLAYQFTRVNHEPHPWGSLTGSVSCANWLSCQFVMNHFHVIHPTGSVSCANRLSCRFVRIDGAGLPGRS